MKKYILNDKKYDSIYEVNATTNYLKALHEENFYYILDLIYGCDFDVEINKDGTINLIDLQGAYLGGFESYENFENIFDACNRLNDSFLFDYYNIR